MKVLVFTNMYPTLEEPWFGSFVHDQVEDLRTLGVDVGLLAFDGRRNRLKYPRAALELRRRLEHDGFDLVHAHYGLTGALALTQRKIPVVTTFHGSDTGHVAWQGHISRLVARRCVPVFVALSGARLAGLPEASVIPAGVDTTVFFPRDRREVRRTLGWDESAHYVLLPGSRSNPTKRADLFDQVVGQARGKIPNLVAKSLEGLPRHEVALVMNAVDATLVTSDSEGSPVAVRESLACGTPVVAVSVGDLPFVLDGLPGCAIGPRDPRVLAGALLEAVDSGERAALRQRAELTSRRRVGKSLVELYAKVVERRT